MAFKLAYSTLRWKSPDLPRALDILAEAGWQGWEARLPLDWLGTPAHVRRVCEDSGIPLVVYTANGSPDQRDRETVEHNKRRMEFAAEVGADCYMFMNGRKPEGREVTEDDLKYAAEGAEAWAEFAEPLGLELSYHIHTNLLVDSVEDWKTYMSMLDKAKLCIDVSHAQLWGYEPVASLKDFKDQLNYVHLQDYASTSRREDGFYEPVWVQVGQGSHMDFPAIRQGLEDINFSRWVTACPGKPPVPDEEATVEAERSKTMYDYLRGIGF